MDIKFAKSDSSSWDSLVIQAGLVPLHCAVGQAEHAWCQAIKKTFWQGAIHQSVFEECGSLLQGWKKRKGVTTNKTTNAQILMMFQSYISYECKVDPGYMLSSVPALSTVYMSRSELGGLLQP